MIQNILIIDDSQAIHNLLRARLKDEMVQLHSATNGEAGLQMARTIMPDLILLDVEMPDPNGFEVCRRLKADPDLVGIPVIFLTGASSTEERIRGLDLGAVDYVTKPFAPEELRARVRAALRMKFMIDLLAKKAQIDGLTGLWNRKYLDDRLAAELSLARRSRRPVALLMIDIDHFKSINDRFGHSVGDEVLRRVSSLLQETVRAEDVACRYGGEEFAVIAPDICSGVVEMGERIRLAIENAKIVIAGKEIPVTVSIGAAGCTGQAEYSLVEHADAALYRAKEAGRNRIEVAGLECSIQSD